MGADGRFPRPAFKAGFTRRQFLPFQVDSAAQDVRSQLLQLTFDGQCRDDIVVSLSLVFDRHFVSLFKIGRHDIRATF